MVWVKQKFKRGLHHVVIILDQPAGPACASSALIFRDFVSRLGLWPFYVFLEI